MSEHFFLTQIAPKYFNTHGKNEEDLKETNSGIYPKGSNS